MTTKQLAPPELLWLLNPSEADTNGHLREIADRILEAFERENDKRKWLEDTKQVLDFVEVLGQRTNLLRGLVLYLVKSKWDSIRLEDRNPYEFEEWAEKATGKKMSTLYNWIRVSGIVIVNPDGIEFPTQIPYQLKAPENGRIRTEVTDFRPELVQHSKLVAAVSRIAAGQMSKTDWSNLVNPSVGHHAFVESLFGHTETKPEKKRAKQFRRESYMILFIDETTGEMDHFIECDPTIIGNKSDPRLPHWNAICEFLNVQ